MSRSRAAAIVLGTLLCVFVCATVWSVQPAGDILRSVAAQGSGTAVRDRSGRVLSTTYQTRWNLSDTVALHDVPPFVQQAFLESEDKRFFDHGGVDWSARAAALWQNISARKTVRGASTITEQVVRIITPRPRTIWSKWVEGVEAMRLEASVDKATIFEFYLNQLPYAANRRGIVQAARYYFDRDLDTLTPKEVLALVVLARAPSAYDLYAHPERIEAPICRLAGALGVQGIDAQPLVVAPPTPDTYAQHFVRFVRQNATASRQGMRTTLDAGLQRAVQGIVDARVRALSARSVHNAGAIVIDHHTGDILAWVVAGAADAPDKTPAADIDPILTPRQPGSALKPFLYGMALENGFTAATILNDAPLAEAVGRGLHRFRNYSGTNYGPITVREALGNSLNIPALLTIRHVGVVAYLAQLQKLGFTSLTRGQDVYDEGLALGNGEVTLLELARAYTALANKGMVIPLRFTLHDAAVTAKPVRAYSDEVASILGNILSDPWARRMEFGADSVLNLPVQTAAKTGTSTDYRDAWVAGFNDRYVVALWMGNLDRSRMDEVTGSVGPALALRSIFALLNKNRETQPLYLSPKLVRADVCIRPQAKDGSCPKRTELFVAGTEGRANAAGDDTQEWAEMVRPTEGLEIAYDPRIPPDHQKFRFEVGGASPPQSVEWILNGNSLGTYPDKTYLWPVQKGGYSLLARLKYDGKPDKVIGPVRFRVK